MIKILHKWEIEKRSSNLIKIVYKYLQVTLYTLVKTELLKMWKRQGWIPSSLLFNILPVLSARAKSEKKKQKLESKEQIILFTDDLIVEKILRNTKKEYGNE